MKAQIIYYTCNTHRPEIDEACRRQLYWAVRDKKIPIISVSLNKPLDFGDHQIEVKGKRSPEMMHKQILIGLQQSTADYVFLCESDVLYHPSHFDFNPKKLDQYTYFYNNNIWKMRYPDGFSFRTDDMKQVSGIVALRQTLYNFYIKRNEQIMLEGFNRHYEPGLKQQVGARAVDTYDSKFPNICIRHDQNITKTKYSPEEFRNKEYAEGWKEIDHKEIPGWVDPLKMLI